MTLNRVVRWLSLALAAGATWIGLSAPAQAIPVFARQTGHNCQACHISYPELTPYGREFKLNGYTFGEAQPIPVAFAIMGEYDHVGKGTDATTGAPTCSSAGGGGPASCGHLELVQYSLFFGGRVSDNFGIFGQMSGGEFPIAAGGGATVGGGFSPTADNTEFRYVHRIMSSDSLEPEAVIGFNMNNNPTMQDVWQSAPAWRFPWFPYLPAGYGALAAPYIDNPTGGHNKVGTGMYAWVHKSVYAEFELYHAATGMLSFLNWGNGGTLAGMGDNPSDVLSGLNPYYRLAYSHDWGYNSVEVGLFGMNSKVYNCNPGGTACAASLVGQTNNYNDIAIDSQYQYNKSEPWVFGANASFIHEKNSLLPLFQEGSVAAIDHTVNEVQARATAYYLRQYGATLGYSSLSGTSDAGLYPVGSGGSATGSPQSSWWTVELNYLPMQDLRFSLLLQDFTKINGGSSNFDGAGNNAGDQRRVSLAIWWVF